ncbi:outer membrane lipoprotein-sorting protein [candidate division WOR-3 bacterium]|nr:outer membrane lipoprotein-sorting protein [candidate division WOR-3 bacterium]
MKDEGGRIKTGLLLALLVPVGAFGLTADEIVARLDENTVAGSMRYEAKMTISLGGQVRTKEFRGWGEGADKAYIEFTAPARDRDTRFLKLGDEMWMWLPEVGKSTKLAGHMLRQSLMGSDFSYSDAAGNARLRDDYSAELAGTDTAGGKTTVVLELTALRPDVDYARQRAWVDTAGFIPRRVEYYAASGKLLKEMRVEDFRRIAGRNFPTRVRMVNRLRSDTWTEMEFTEIELDVTVPPGVFDKSYLER